MGFVFNEQFQLKPVASAKAIAFKTIAAAAAAAAAATKAAAMSTYFSQRSPTADRVL